jgi:SAM-dependent methyltransferase
MANTIDPARPFSFTDLLAPLPEGASVLDLGCGGGTFDYRRFPHLRICALDEHVHEKVEQFPSNVCFKQESAIRISEPDERFDLVLVNFAFEHFPAAAACLREIDRVTRDGGRVWLSTPNAGSFEDQLYRNLYAGGGHLQRPGFEWLIRALYENTSLVLISYQELPAGFTFLGDSEALRHLTWALVDALRRTVGVDARIRSGYVLILQKFVASGPAFVEHARCCSLCGSPDSAVRESAAASEVQRWTCSTCGGINEFPSRLTAIKLDEVQRAMELQWARYPEIRPQRLREIVDERTEWAQSLEREIVRQREELAKLQEGFDARGRWAQSLDREIENLRSHAATLQAENRDLRRIIGRPADYVRYLWNRHCSRRSGAAGPAR